MCSFLGSRTFRDIRFALKTGHLVTFILSLTALSFLPPLAFLRSLGGPSRTGPMLLSSLGAAHVLRASLAIVPRLV